MRPVAGAPSSSSPAARRDLLYARSSDGGAHLRRCCGNQRAASAVALGNRGPRSRSSSGRTSPETAPPPVEVRRSAQELPLPRRRRRVRARARRDLSHHGSTAAGGRRGRRGNVYVVWHAPDGGTAGSAPRLCRLRRGKTFIPERGLARRIRRLSLLRPVGRSRRRRARSLSPAHDGDRRDDLLTASVGRRSGRACSIVEGAGVRDEHLLLARGPEARRSVETETHPLRLARAQRITHAWADARCSILDRRRQRGESSSRGSRVAGWERGNARGNLRRRGWSSAPARQPGSVPAWSLVSAVALPDGRF